MIKSRLNTFLTFYNLNQVDLADSTGINRNTIGRYCNDTFERIDKSHIDLLCSFFQCKFDDIFEVDNTLEIKYPSEMVKNMIESYKVMKKLAPEEKDNINTDVDENSSLKTTINKPKTITSRQVVKKAKAFEEKHGYNPIPTDDELYELEQMQDKLDMEYDLERNLKKIIDIIISDADMTKLPLKLKSEIEAYKKINDIALSFKFILVYRSLYVLIVKQFYNKQLIDFISKLRRIYNTGGLLELDDTILMDLANESNYLLNKINNIKKD